MSQRYFRTDSDDAYEQARAALDTLWQYPPGMTSITPSIAAPRDAQGRIVLAVDAAACSLPGAAELLAGMLAAGAAVEITEDEYHAAIPKMP